MKKTFNFIFSIVLFFTIGSISAQTPELWGIANEGGAHNVGAIYKTDANGNVSVEHSFMVDEKNPSTSLLLAPNGKAYGMTNYGGDKNLGILYEFDLSNNTLIKKVDFTGNDNGTYPKGDLLLASNGKIYGVTTQGGINDNGTLFEYDINTETLTKLIDFDEANNGGNPIAGLIQATNGKLYGVTSNGGVNDDGILFSYDINTNTLTKLVDFESAVSGANPQARLLQASNGMIYGTTYRGGTNDLGTIFQYNITSDTFQTILSFSDYGKVNTGFMEASNGKLYSISSDDNHNATLFSFDKDTNTVTNLHDFVGYCYGNKKDLIQAPDNKIYGVLSGGGQNGNGYIFSYDITTETFSNLFDFDQYISGERPFGQFININNVLYGVTKYGGMADIGVVYSFDIITQTYQNLYNIKGSELGFGSYGKLLQISNDKFLGLLHQGGQYGVGVIFEYDKSNGNYTKLYDFNKTDGAEPLGTFVKANNGKYYSTTFFGGVNNHGVLFEYDYTTNTYTKIVDFDDYGLRFPLYIELINTPNGTLMGTNAFGGANNGGAIFKYNPSNQDFSVVYDFENTTGRFPYGNLLFASNGKIYGTTKYGGSHSDGVIYEFDPATNNYTKLYDFDRNTSGRNPRGKLIETSNGLLYGTTYKGGANSDGTLFKYNFNNNTFTKILDFDLSTTGGNPIVGDFCLASDGLLYGVLTKGGVNDNGTLFSLNPSTDTFTKLFDFDNEHGSAPMGTVIEYNPNLSIEENSFSVNFNIFPNPVQNRLNVIFDYQMENISAALFNINGKLIKTKDFRNTNLISFEMLQPQGVYLLKLKDDKGHNAVIKVIKE